MTTAPDVKATWRWRQAGVAVAAVACVPYVRTIRDYFVQDDFGVVQLLARKEWSTFPRWFTMPWMEDIWGYTPDEIRPFPALSYQITALWGAGAPEGHHLLNIALHAANALLVMAMARRVAGLGLAGAALSGAAFALLPVAAESVAWITGRVDTMPALFYFASFLAYVHWRQTPGAARQYVWSLVWFFLALFSKQNTITMVATLAAYDAVVARRPVRPTWAWLRPYVPFILMTAAFLALRFAVLGEVLRESQLSARRLDGFGGIILRHVQRIVFGDAGRIAAPAAILAGAFSAAVIAAVAAAPREVRSGLVRGLVYFGPVWLAIGLAPALAAGYESPRHAYLAAAGWAIVIGIGYERMAGLRVARSGTPAPARRAAAAAMLVVLGAYAWQLHGVVTDWRTRAAVSEAAARALEREVASAASGTLVIVGAPVSSWEWAAPFVARPPYASADLTSRARIVTPRLLDCCRGAHWENRTRGMLDDWTRGGSPVVALHIGPDGEVRRLDGADDPDLAALVLVLPEIPSADRLDGALLDLLRKLVAGRGEVVRPASFPTR